MTIKPNDELRHDWRVSLQQRRGLKQSTISAKLSALTEYETFTAERSFLKLRREDVRDFKDYLLSTKSATTDLCLSCSAVVHTLDHCRDFFTWLADQKEGRKLDREAIAWFAPNRADKERARAVPSKPVPSISEATAAFAAMPTITLQNRRDRAVIAILLLTAIRADALASVTLGSINLATGSIWLDSRIVRTKNAKSFNVFLLPFFFGGARGSRWMGR